MMSLGSSGTSLAAPAARATTMMPNGSLRPVAVAAMRESISTPMMPSSGTRFFAGSAIADTESNSLRASTGFTLRLICAAPLSTTSWTLSGRISEAEVVADGRQVVGGLAVHRHQDVADVQTGRLRRTAGPDVGHDDAVVSRQSERRGHARRDGLQAHADFLPAQRDRIA